MTTLCRDPSYITYLFNLFSNQFNDTLFEIHATKLSREKKNLIFYYIHNTSRNQRSVDNCQDSLMTTTNYTSMSIQLIIEMGCEKLSLPTNFTETFTIFFCVVLGFSNWKNALS